MIQMNSIGTICFAVLLVIAIVAILTLACAVRDQSQEIARLRGYLRQCAAPHRWPEIYDGPIKYDWYKNQIKRDERRKKLISDDAYKTTGIDKMQNKTTGVDKMVNMPKV